MHVSGKVLAGLAIVGMLGALYMSSKAFAVRDAWMKAAQDQEAAIKKNDEEIATKTGSLKDKRAEYARTMLGWDREWLAPNAQVQGFNVQLQVGTNQGIQPGQLLYVFAQNPDGTSVYLGDFKVERAVEGQCAAVPYSRHRPTDAKQVPLQNVRVRTMLPNQYANRLNSLDQQLLEAEHKVRSNQEELARQARLGEQVEKLIAARLAELNGNPDMANQQIPEVHIKGLLSSIVDEEEARNSALIEADRLMRELKKTRDEFQTIRKENQQRVDSLPGSTGEQSASR